MQSYRENVFPGIASITDCDKENGEKMMLLYHIVDGEYSSYGQLQVEADVCIDNASRRKGVDDDVCLEEPMAGCRRKDS